MSKIMRNMIFVEIVILLFLAGCGMEEKSRNTDEEKANVEKRFTFAEINPFIELMIDKKKQIQYLRVRASGIEGETDIIPLLDSDRKPYKSLDIGDLSKRFTLEEYDGTKFLLTDNQTNIEYLIVFSNDSLTHAVKIITLE